MVGFLRLCEIVMKPKRGEIWLARIGKWARGTEMGRDKPDKPRPCLILSTDSLPEEAEAVTVAPLTESTIAQPVDSMNNEVIKKKTFWWDTVVDPSQLLHVPNVPQMVYLPSIITTAHIWTILEELCPDSRTAVVPGRIMQQIDRRLDMVLGGQHDSWGETLSIAQGDIVRIDFLNGSRELCLVISGNRFLRETLRSLLAVVPLRAVAEGGAPDPAAPEVEVRPEKGEPIPTRMRALCPFIWAFDRQVRAAKKVGRVRGFDAVRRAVRFCLDLPVLEDAYV